MSDPKGNGTDRKPTQAERLTTDEAIKKLFSPRVLRELKREIKRLEKPVTDHEDKDS